MAAVGSYGFCRRKNLSPLDASFVTALRPVTMCVKLNVEASTRDIGDLCRVHKVEKSAPQNVLPVNSEAGSDFAEPCVLRVPVAGEGLIEQFRSESISLLWIPQVDQAVLPRQYSGRQRLQAGAPEQIA